MAIIDGRQVAPTILSIRPDHVERYNTARRFIQKHNLKQVLDAGAGIGYGSYIMAQAGCRVTSVERNTAAIKYGEEHYQHDDVLRVQDDVRDITVTSGVDLVTAFEIIEHIDGAQGLISHWRCNYLMGSVPNEDVTPFSNSKHHEHVRHYTPEQLLGMLNGAGWNVIDFGSQADKFSGVDYSNTDGMTLVFTAVRA